MDFERQNLDLNLNTRPSWVVVDGWFPPSLGPNATILWACVWKWKFGPPEMDSFGKFW